jgi:macrodomain Ter protein organizer (MatP/YcbG family)
MSEKQEDTTPEKQEEVDVLEQVKKVEKAIKAKILIEKIGELKTIAKEINELKEQSLATLEELQLSEKDMKRIIDYINELPDVKLTDKEKQKIRDEISEEMTGEKEENEKSFRDIDIEKFMKAAPFVGYSYSNTVDSSTTGFSTTAGGYYAGSDTFTLTCSNSSGPDDVLVVKM